MEPITREEPRALAGIHVEELLESPARELLDAGWEAPLELSELPGPDDEIGRIRAVARGDFTVLAVPEEFGGLGGDMLAVAAAQRQLALVDPGLAIGLCMHSHSVGVMVEHHRRLRDSSWMLLEALGDRRCLVGSAFAEPGGSANLMRSRTVARRDGKGYRLSGIKFPCSLVTTAELFCLSANAVESGETLVALLPAGTQGMETDASAWPSLGMRSSDTGKLVLSDVPLDDRLVYHRAPSGSVDPIVVMGFVWFAVLMGATYAGVLSALVDAGAEAVRAQEEKTGELAGPGRRRVALVGAAARAVLSLQSACRTLAAQWQAEALAGPTALAAAMAVRSLASEARDAVVTSLTPVIGSRLYTDGHGAASLALDSLAVHHHPPALLICDEGIGSACIGRSICLDADQ
jgi:alkylation response protein AidB-like acyl-CoA dehydrogenase